MNTRPRASASVVAFVAALTLGVGGCSEPVSLAGYADSMSATAASYVEEAQTLSLRYQSGVEDGVRDLIATSEEPEEKAVDLVRGETVQFLALLEDAMTRYSETLAATKPPSEVEAEHGAYLAAVEFVVGAMPETRQGIVGAETLDDIGYALNVSGFSDGQDRWTATCASLEQAVRDQGRGMDLKCEEAQGRASAGGSGQP